jgi:RNA polymerase sigma factor (sigma-70 family)
VKPNAISRGSAWPRRTRICARGCSRSPTACSAASRRRRTSSRRPFLRYQSAIQEHKTEIDSPKAYLSAVTTRLAIDHLRSGRVRKETYVGEWLPEPLLTDERSPDAAEHAEQSDSLSMAFLLLLERLSPVERAVFLLHDVFDYSYDEVSGIVRKSEDNCRQLAVRARRHVKKHKPRFEASRQQRERLAGRFFDAVEQGDMEGLIELLAADVVVYGDGGGHSPSWRRPIYGRDKVVRLLGIGRHTHDLGRQHPAHRGQRPARRAVPRPGRAPHAPHDRRRRRRRRPDGARDHQPGQAPPPRPARRRPRAAAQGQAATIVGR